MARVLLIGIGGFVGSVLRYWLSGVAQTAAGTFAFPIGTLAVNVLGCFVIGILSELVESRGFLHPDTRALLLIGVLGGFTTFSTFANETVLSFRDGALAAAIGNIILSVSLCLGAVWIGRSAAHFVWR